MPSSQARSSPATSGGKRGKGRTKQKRLDAIVDRPLASSIVVDRPPASSIVDDDPGYLRRSSRVRRVPVVLDSSPFLTNRTANPEPLEPPIPVRKEQTPSIEESKGSGGWRSRLRSSLAKGREMKSMNQVMSEGKGKVGLDSKRLGSRKKRKKPLHEDELENAGDVGEAQEEAEQMDVDDHAGVGLFNGEAGEVDETLKPNNVEPVVLDDKDAGSHVKEGRRCGLCGGGISGRPPKRLAQESVDSDKEAYEGASASEEPNYDMWDGFGDEPGWLGRLLGPIHDRFGIARVWVHQHCAVWSPEVYFAGLGCLKNVRAALCRGRVLKCSRCGRSGATIGCRVDRCPKTYHLPCSRADGCIFDHEKYLIACHDHRHLFQPQGNDFSLQIKKMKAKKLKLDMRKVSTDAWRKDLEAEDKWLENCGEDEEFLKREGRRLHRDILRIAPVYIGGSSESGELYQGWESVAGLQEVIQCMKEVVILPLLYPEFFSSLGLTPPRGILLHGYPGTGKTLVVRALIGACSRGDKRIAYFARKGADCLGKYVGDAERQLRLLFQVAERSQPSIIFFDEIDGLAPLRSRHQDQTHCSVVSTLLSLMDGLKSRGSVIVIGATNRPEAVDPALRRPGRFDREIYFPLPSEKGRSEILSLHTRSWPNPVSGSLLSWVANQTAGYAGADLQALCTQAAMNALKRNCPLQELLSSAEKGSGHGNLPSLPSFIVEERDWLRALALAPPPCSRRDAGSSANDAVCSPLQSHLVPYLLQPLSQLLASFYIDERIWLPPRLFRASESIKCSIVFALEQKKVPTISWWSHVHCLTEDPSVENEIERGLSSHGLIIGPSGSSQCYAPEDGNDDHEKLHIKCRNSSGFRALISGAPRSGQKHLASCLLHGFSGHIEIQKVTLATMSLEGHGDLIRGLAHILLKCLNAGPCIIYMPRIDLWAIDKTPGQEAEENPEAHVTPISSPSAEVPDARESASEAWNSFVEQVDSACTSQSIIILATCEVENKDLPLGIRQFFTSNVLDHTDSAPLEHSIPRFYIHLDGKFDHDQVLDSSAVKLSQDLVRHYVQLLHFRAHMNNSQDKNKATHSMEVVSELQRQNMEGRLDSERISSNSGASCKNNPTQQDLSGEQRWSVLSKIRSFQEVDIQFRNHQDFTPRALPGKVIKGGSMLAITTFGYQILRYPQFAELCWVTSKLKEGPSANPNGPWKHWPFNSGVTYPGGNCSNLKDKENTSLVRGLIAVGLLAYRGVYTSVREVSFEVRKVLELLVEQIREKILSRKDRYRYLRVLSQVAYLEDMVNSWAYTFQSLQTDNQTVASNAKPTIVERLHEDKNLSSSIPVDNQSSMPGVPSISCNEVQEVSHRETPQKFDGSNGQCGNFSNGIADTALLNSDTSMVPEANQFQELSPSSPTPSTSHPTSSLAPLRVVNGDGPSQLERTTPSNGSLNDFAVRKNNLSGVPAALCLYECCSECLQAVYMLAHRVLSGSLRLNGPCSTLDDIDAVVASCSVNLLAAIGKVCASQSNACQEFCKHDKKSSCCHSKSKEDTPTISSGRNSLLQSPLSFFFRDGVLIPSNPQEDAVFHCKFERLCTCSILETMLMIKQPLD